MSPVTALAGVIGQRRGSAPAAGLATQLTVTTQPSGAEDGVAFTQQPIVEVRDGLGDVVAGSSAEITVAKATGSGTLSGDTAVSASSGVATFTDLVITGTGDHTLTFTSPGLTPVNSQTIDVGDGGVGGETALFESDWGDAAEGNTQAALTDGGKWNDTTNLDTSVLSVVSTAGLSFPAGMEKCLQVRLFGESGGVVANGQWSVPGIGEKLFYRVYHRVDITDDQGNQSVSHHPLEFNAGAAAFHFEHFTGTVFNNGGYLHRYQFLHMSDVGDSTRRRFVMGSPETALSKSHTYRHEWMFERTGADTWTIDIRVYNESGTLVRDASNMYNANGSATLASNPDNMVFDPEYTDEMYVGTSGGTWSFTEDQFVYWGGFMVRSDDWCGAYVAP